MTGIRWNPVIGWGLGLGLLTSIIIIWLASTFGLLSAVNAAIITLMYGIIGIALISYAISNSGK